MKPSVTLHPLSVGYCRHCERVTLAGGRFKIVTFPSMCGLILHASAGPILFDTGYADHFMDATAPMPERFYRWATPVTLPADQTLTSQLAAFGLAPKDVLWCLISHFHADHVAGLKDLPRARFIATRAAVEHVQRLGRWRGLINATLPSLLPRDFSSRLSFVDDLPRRQLRGAWSVLGDGFDLLGDGSLLAIPLPGHARGQMGLCLRDAADREVLLCADACWSRIACEELRLPSLLVRPLTDNWAAYRHTLQHLHQLTLAEPGVVILPSHCERSIAEYTSPALQACNHA
jgi:glyoxylase-like metal-dependent hydrolase (beta-lactamase superfamily II)